MAAQPDVSAPAHGQRQEPETRRSAVVLPLRSPEPGASALIERASGSRLGPAQGLLLGLGMGAVLWAGLGVLAWAILHR